jgi:NF-kappa-B inhibitor-interacting Ras-like protein
MPIKPFYSKSRRRSLGTALQPSSSDMEGENEVKSTLRPRLASTSTLRRPSLTQFLFGGKSQNNLLSANYPSRGASQISLSSTGSNNNLNRRRPRASIAIPIDSQRHSFGSETESEDEGIIDDEQINQQQSLAESVEAFLALRRQNQSATKAQSKQQSKAVMRKVMRVVVLGARKTGKTAILQQLACFNDITTQPYISTIDDTYQIQTQLDPNDLPKEVIIFHDTAGIQDFGNTEIRRPYLQVADAFILVYSVVEHETFNKMDILKRNIEKHFTKEKKDIPIVIIGTMTDLSGRQVSSEFANTYANKERVKLFEVSATNRSSLVDIIHYLSGRYFHPIKESKFSLSKRLRPEKSNASSQQVLTDI